MRFFLAIWAVCLWAAAVSAQDLSALARFDPSRSFVSDEGRGIAAEFALSQPVPWRVRVLDNPPRLILDVREVDWTGIGTLRRGDRVADLRAGVFRSGWSRLVVEMNAPYLVGEAAMDTGDRGAVIRLRLDPAEAGDFAAKAALPEPPGWALPEPSRIATPPARSGNRLMVVLDPGHGGLDPGAENGPHREAHLMLTFAREFKELLQRDGRFDVVMTREEDVFVPLETRISIARAVQADVFLSLHADALAEGQAVGATIYSLADEASDAASAALAERHDRDDLLAGVDLTGQDDLVARVLLDMARTETRPRIDRLAMSLEGAIKAEGLKMHRRPRQEAGFSVLKSPDIPSVLVELGFMSSDRDLERLIDPEWRARMAAALRDGIARWAAEDAALAGLVRR
ncbi:N-acetylmuramoyl-L-alanine amidase [Aliigemmobacter aestuarii]|uniref:N-acetylmuramoyl-L-alanine amidase n=1 Tax=Aliigemmobacter aestuarii TaxID=1445661 RepID=A0A4V3V0K2_9RHOB|nr:N-acetylmuramoyl-L-alanine amidase [Gemmobacter aestuarii]THD84212.1 N-acetylmuramoyl-L-alanine amidase [Gemmobacter aestuarii]